MDLLQIFARSVPHLLPGRVPESPAANLRLKQSLTLCIIGNYT
jgi:hypothetical protein